MSRIDEINAILDDLGDTPSDAELEYRLRDYGTRELLEVVADRAAGSGGSAAVSVELRRNTQIDVSAATAHNVAWQTCLDNSYDGNPIAVPDALGLTISLDGSDPTIHTEEDGIWLFHMSVELPNDPNILFRLEPVFPAGMIEDTHGPGIVGKTAFGNFYCARREEIAQLRAGVDVSSLIRVYTAASVSPLNTGNDISNGKPMMTIVRLA